VLLDAIVQFTGQAISLFDDGQRAHLVGEAGVALPQFVQILLVPFHLLGQEVQLLGQQAQVVGRRVRYAQREVAAQPGAADLSHPLQAAADAPAGPCAQQQPDQRSADCHQRRGQAPIEFGGNRPARGQHQCSQCHCLGDEGRRQRHRYVGQRQPALQAHS
jgi:hypothetical protein